MKWILTLCISFFFSANLMAQCSQNIHLQTQAEVDAFPVNYGCDLIIGQLIIGGVGTVIYNIDSLNSIEQIIGDLRIAGNEYLSNLDGLSNLNQINGDLYIGDYYEEDANPVLENIDGLSNLASVNDLYICRNNVLLNLDGLSSLTTVGGDFYIGDSMGSSINGSGNSSLENIDGLSNLTFIDGKLMIFGNNSLQNLDGLENLTEIGSSLFLSNNDGLENIDGFSSLTTIGWYLSISGNDSITNLEGLQNLTEVGFVVSIRDNSSLQTLSGLENLEEIVGAIGYLEISNNDALIDLDPLINITSIQGDLRITENTNLTNVDGFSNLANLGGSLVFWGNNSLTNLDAFINLTSIEGSLVIGSQYFSNQSLENIDGLSNINYVEFNLTISDDLGLSNLDALSSLNYIGGTLTINQSGNLVDVNGLFNVNVLGGNLIIEDNNNLSDCCTALYLASIAQGEEIIIEDNDMGCNSIEDAAGACGFQKITAVAFFDENENDVYEEDEIILNNSFSLSPNEYFSYSNQEIGADFILDDFGDYTLTYNDDFSLWNLSNGISESIEISYPSPTFTDVYYFPLVPIGDFTLQDVDLTSSITRCNQNTNYWITYTNNGTTINDGYVQLVPDEVASFSYSNPQPDSIAGDTLFWFYQDLYPTHSGQIQVVYGMPSVDLLGENMDFEAEIQTWEGFGDDKVVLSSELICAYDPNDKLVTPEGVGAENYTLYGDTLEYTIRFQNTGNDTAFTIVVRDTLDTYLNLTTFRPISSSHSVQTRLDLNERVAVFTFENIYLPDSFVNEVGSHGFVKFQILTNSNPPDFITIENTAGIFFDANPPIVTNTVNNMFVSDIPSVFFGKIFLEGAYENDGQMTVLLDNLIPLEQPFNESPWNYNGNENLNNLPENMVDWILVEARTGIPSLTISTTEVVERHAGILLANGEILNANGTTGIRFVNLEEDEQYYISIHHRNHLDILSATSIPAALNMGYDFTTNIASAFGPEQQKISSDGKSMMIAGDANIDGLIQTTDYDNWVITNDVINTYSPTDFNLDGIIQTTDYDLWFLNRSRVGIGELQY